MFSFFSKTLGWLISPINFIATLAAIGLLLRWSRWRNAGRNLLAAPALLLVAGAFSPLGSWLLVPIEQRFPAMNAASAKPTGIIVLGGSIAPDLSTARGIGVFPSSADRLVAAAELARRFPDVPVIFTGGSATLAIGDAREADFAAGIFDRLGLPKDRVMLERNSRNTIENARFVRDMVSPKPGDRWLLITSAYHMPRSVGLFRNVGFDVQPYPVDWLTAGEPDLYKISTRPLDGLIRTEIGAREWIGMTANWLSGNSKEIFPR